MDAAALLCNICPKRPRFSDVSHLLTHVSSKAHLSHYFKLQVRSHQEPPAVALLDEYDRWYKANNLAKLLSDRMSSKDDRKKRPPGNATARNKSCTTRRNAGSKIPPAKPCSTPRASLPHYLDPRLADYFLNMEPEISNGGTPLSTGYTTVTSSIPDGQARRGTDYALISFMSSGTPKGPAFNQQKLEEETGGDHGIASILQSTPCWSRSLGIIADSASRSLGRHVSYDPFVDDNDNDGEMDKERAEEIARLKGVLWPGMDIFDSATEQMRRKRNQKKDQSILKMMEKTSMCVEPTELIFSPTGVLRKQRVISGNVDDSSPLKGETPIPRRRATRPKRVLSQVDSNIYRGQDRKRGKKTAKENIEVFDDGLDRRGLLLLRSPCQLPARLGNYSSHGDDADELEMSLGQNNPKSRSEFSIFRDEPHQCSSGLNGYYSGQGPISSGSPFLRQETMASGTFHPMPPGNYHSASTEGATQFSFGKENIEPLLNIHGRIDPLVGWTPPAIRRHIDSDPGYPPQYFFSDSQRIGMSPFESNECHVGYSYNPLAASFSRLPADENVYFADADQSPIKQSVTRTTSPEVIISDLEEDDFERLYLDGSSD